MTGQEPSGCSSVWLEHRVWDAGVARSNRVIPTYLCEEREPLELCMAKGRTSWLGVRPTSWGCSAAGSASVWHTEGPEFESPHLHVPIKDRDARRRYNKEWVAARRAEWFKGKACVMCGASDNLELDHVDPSKKVSHRIWSWSKDRRETELEKCQPLCQTCHYQKTDRDLGRGAIVHGKNDTYTFRRCRCEQCKAAHAVAARLYRAMGL